MNSVNVIGNIGNISELEHRNGHAKLRMSVAVERRVKSDGRYEKQTSWVSVTLWDKRAEALSQYLSKGDKVGVSGELSVRRYEKKDGSQGTDVSLERADVTLLGSSQRRESGSGYGGGGKRSSGFGSGGQDYPADDFGDDEIPF